METVLGNVLLNNVGETEKTQFGYKLHRFPLEVEKHMNEHARWMSNYSCGCEIRFVSSVSNVEITLLAEQGTPNITVFQGDYVYLRQDLEIGKITTIRLSKAKINNSNLSESFYKNNRFSRDVWRIWLHNGCFTFCGVNGCGGDIRPPKSEEMPEKTLLCYGSSITHGAGALMHYSCYANQLAVKLGTDVLIKGTGGSCFCEKEVSDYLANESWDYALLEPVVNMLDSFSESEFEKRVSYLIDTIAKKNKPVFVTTMYTNDIVYNVSHSEHEKYKIFDEITRKICRKYKNILLVEGQEILDKTEYLTADGIHPCDYGHFMMAQNWYSKIKKILVV